MEIIIREAKIEEVQKIIDFQKKMAMEKEEMVLDNDTILNGVLSVFSDPGKGRYYVADDGEKAIASLMITYEWSDWRNSYVRGFQSVYVLPEYRRHGVFRKMYNHIKELALSSDAAGLRLYVEVSNDKAHLTYESMGMTGDNYRLYEWLR